MKLDPIPGAPDWLKKCPSTGRFYVSKYRADLAQPRLERRIKSELGLDDKMTVKQAIRLGETMLAAWISGQLPKKRGRVTIADVVPELIAYRESRFTIGKIRKRTWAHDKAYLPNIAKWFGDLDPRDIDESLWENWYDETGVLMNRTHADTAKYLSMTLSFCLKKKWIERKPVIKNLDGREYKGRIYTKEELAALFDAADPVMQQQVKVGFECGMRTHEVRELQWSMITFQDGGAIIRLPKQFTKTAEAREFNVNQGVFALLFERFSARKSDKYVWPSPHRPEFPESDSSFYARFRKAVAGALIQGPARFYDLRHTFFNQLVFEKGMSLEMVSEYGGNSPATLRANYLRRTASNTKSLVGLVEIGTAIDCGKISESAEKEEPSI